MKIGNREVNGRAYVANFNFKGSDQQKKVGAALRRRAQPRAPRQDAARRAPTCSSSTSRPTTSTSTRCAPSRTRLEAFAGCAVVISHDRWFLDRIATHILAFEGDSQVRWFEGNFTRVRGVAATRSSAPRPTSPTASSTIGRARASRSVLHLSSSGGRPVRVEVARVGARREVVFSRTRRRRPTSTRRRRTPPRRGAAGRPRSTLDVDPTWRSGYYEVVMEIDVGEKVRRDHAFFVVRPPSARRRAIVLALATNTWHAYNDFGGPQPLHRRHPRRHAAADGGRATCTSRRARAGA